MQRRNPLELALPEGMVAISRRALEGVMSAATSARGCTSSAPAHVEEMIDAVLAELGAVQAGNPHGRKAPLPHAA